MNVVCTEEMNTEKFVFKTAAGAHFFISTTGKAALNFNGSFFPERYRRQSMGEPTFRCLVCGSAYAKVATAPSFWIKGDAMKVFHSAKWISLIWCMTLRNNWSSDGLNSRNN